MSKAYPKFIKEHEQIKKYAHIEKVFTKIGLKNYSENFCLAEVPNTKKAIALFVSNSVEKINSAGNLKAKKFIEKVKLNASKFAVKKGKDFEIKFPFKSDITAPGYWGDIKIKKGSSFTKTFTNEIFDLNSSFDEYQDHCKELSSKGKKLKLNFSCEGDLVKWDLATMSMRGIDSCQNWDSSHRNALIGSILDPYAAIIYISDEKNKMTLGSRMIKRSIVRLVFNRNTGSPALLIERIYPHDYDSDVSDTITLNVFRNFLAKKTKNKYKIIYGGDDGNGRRDSANYFIPITRGLFGLSTDEFSYIDSALRYERPIDYHFFTKKVYEKATL